MKVKINDEFGKLVIISKDTTKTTQKHAYWLCKCKCGKIKSIRQSSLRDGTSKSCGCNRTPNIKNQRFGKLIVLEKTKRTDKRHNVYWQCECDCGNVVETTTTNLTMRSTKSCGCLRKQNNYSRRNKKLPGDLVSQVWYRILSHAKVRKIKFDITPEYAWELFEKQNKKCALSGIKLYLGNNLETKFGKTTASLDRIDSSKEYCIGNVQWVHKDINRMKSNIEEKKFIEYCTMVSKKYALEKNNRFKSF